MELDVETADIATLDLRLEQPALVRNEVEEGAQTLEFGWPVRREALADCETAPVARRPHHLGDLAAETRAQFVVDRGIDQAAAHVRFLELTAQVLQLFVHRRCPT